jgi:hypothetical protein
MRPEQFSSGNLEGVKYEVKKGIVASMRPEQFSFGNFL